MSALWGAVFGLVAALLIVALIGLVYLAARKPPEPGAATPVPSPRLEAEMEELNRRVTRLDADRQAAALFVLAEQDGSMWAQAHDRDPGGDGLVGAMERIPRRESVRQNEWTFRVNDACGPVTHVSFWDSQTGGRFLGATSMSPAEAFSGHGSLYVRLEARAGRRVPR